MPLRKVAVALPHPQASTVEQYQLSAGREGRGRLVVPQHLRAETTTQMALLRGPSLYEAAIHKP
jgi:hypothetical protein